VGYARAGSSPAFGTIQEKGSGFSMLLKPLFYYAILDLIFAPFWLE
jgi:hypothetical protein